MHGNGTEAAAAEALQRVRGIRGKTAGVLRLVDRRQPARPVETGQRGSTGRRADRLRLQRRVAALLHLDEDTLTTHPLADGGTRTTRPLLLGADRPPPRDADRIRARLPRSGGGGIAPLGRRLREGIARRDAM